METTQAPPRPTEPAAAGLAIAQPENGNVAATGFQSAEDWLEWASQQA